MSNFEKFLYRANLYTMKLSKSELLEILLNVIKHDYCLGKLGTILEIIDIYEPREEVHPQRKLTEILLSDEEEEDDCFTDNPSKYDSDESSDESSVANYLTEGEEEV